LAERPGANPTAAARKYKNVFRFHLTEGAGFTQKNCQVFYDTRWSEPYQKDEPINQSALSKITYLLAAGAIGNSGFTPTVQDASKNFHGKEPTF
jgi:hypothetical protein